MEVASFCIEKKNILSRFCSRRHWKKFFSFAYLSIESAKFVGKSFYVSPYFLHWSVNPKNQDTNFQFLVFNRNFQQTRKMLLPKPITWTKLRWLSPSLRAAYIRRLKSNEAVGKTQESDLPKVEAENVKLNAERQRLPDGLLEPDEIVRPSINPKETSIVLFPGQGTQYVGMAKNLMRFPEARSIFKLANEILKYDLLKICLEGPQEKLNRTEYAQPAVMVTSLAALEQLREERPRAIDSCVATAGFSLGELTALTFAGALPFDRALRLVQVRATAMQVACEQAKGGMALVLYAPDTQLGDVVLKAHQWCLDRGIENPYCGIANYMYPHCKVIAGHIEALDFIDKNAKTLKIKRMKRLPVSGAFHTPLMTSAVEPFGKALSKVQIVEPLIRVYSNVDGKPYKNPSHILRQLPKQIVRPVKWEQTMHEMYERKQNSEFPRTFECGPGKGLLQILQKVNAKAAITAYNVEA